MNVSGQTHSRNGLGIAALVLGLLAVVLSWTILGALVLGVLALIFGFLGRARVKRGEATNGGMSVAGIVLGIIGLLLAIGLLVFGNAVLNSPAGQNFQECMERAGDDPERAQQCAAEFGRDIGGNPE